MESIFARAEKKRHTALHILDELRLMERWAAFGQPILVGAVAYGLVVTPDLDMEIYCPVPRIEDGLEVLRQCAQHPWVGQAAFLNALDGPDQALYWRLKLLDPEGVEWKVDMWSAALDHPGPTARDMVAPMSAALTQETRRAILEIKEARVAGGVVPRLSIDIYRSVMQDGVRTPAQFDAWAAVNPEGGLVAWKPAP